MKNQTKNTFNFSVFYAIKKNFIIPLISMFGLLFMLISNFLEMSGAISDAKLESIKTGQSIREILSKSARYIFIYSSEDMYGYNFFTEFISVFIVIAAALLGIMLFRFVTSKKTVNVYYSLGIKRAELYGARYLAGVVMLFASIVVPMLIMTFVNIHFFGSSAMLWKACFYYIVHFSVIAFAAFSIAAAVSGCVGTVIESVGFSAVLIAFPSIVMMCVEEIVPALLLGAPMNGIMYYNDSYNSGYLQNTISETLFGRILANVDLLSLNREGFFSIGCAISKEVIKSWKLPSFSPYIFWIIGIAVFLLFGILMFKNRKAEICGFMGRNKVLNFTVCALLSFSAFSLISSYTNHTITVGDKEITISIWVMALVGALISFIVFSVVELLLTRSFKAYRKNLKIVPVHIALILVLIFSLYTGFFGYSSRMPDIEDVESVEISTPASLTGGTHNGYLSNCYSDVNWWKDYHKDSIPNAYYLNSDSRLLDGIKDRAFIRNVMDIHQKIIDSGWITKESTEERLDYSNRSVSVNLVIRYKLKDGTDFVRSYSRVPLEIYESLFQIEDSDRWNEIVSKELSELSYDTAVPVIFSKQMDKKTFVSENLVSGLGQALAKDIAALGYKDFWRSEEQWLGAIVLYGQDSSEYVEEDFYGNKVEITSPDGAETDIGADEAEIQARIAENNWKAGSDAEYTPLISNNGRSYVIPITVKMKNTISYLQSNGLYTALNDDSPVISARVISAAEATAESFWGSEMPIFNAFWDNGKAKAHKVFDEYGGFYVEDYTSGDYMPGSSVTVTDKEALKELSENAYGWYLDINGGYIVEFKRANGCTTIMFVPAGRISKTIG